MYSHLSILLPVLLLLLSYCSLTAAKIALSMYIRVCCVLCVVCSVLGLIPQHLLSVRPLVNFLIHYYFSYQSYCCYCSYQSNCSLTVKIALSMYIRLLCVVHCVTPIAPTIYIHRLHMFVSFLPSVCMHSTHCDNNQNLEICNKSFAHDTFTLLTNHTPCRVLYTCCNPNVAGFLCRSAASVCLSVGEGSLSCNGDPLGPSPSASWH